MEPGTTLGPYRIDREIGSGGMGRVYAATLERESAGLAAGTRVALKVLHPHLLETEGFFRRFLQEARIGASIRHDNVVRTYLADALAAGGAQRNFLVMEYVEGRTLAELRGELDRVPEELCLHVAREICKGLTAVHAAGVVHRDLKPDNVLITPEHVVKIMDLGVARVADEAMRLSRTGAFVGSLEYAAPEQFRGGVVDGRTDLHALGVLLYELASGTHPYRGGSFHEVLGRVCDEEPRRLGDLNSQLSPFFEEVVHTLLVKDPRGRFASASQLLDVLSRGESSPWWRERVHALRAATERPLRRIRIPRETALFGRETELGALRDLYGRARSGDGQVVLVHGEAGIGKSRIVDELISRLQADGEDPSFLFGSYPPNGATSSEGGLSTAYREQLGDAGSAPYLADAPLLAPAFDALLAGRPPPPDALHLTRDSIGTCFVHVTRGLAAERPVVVLIDDLHFAPAEAISIFTALALAAPGHRVMLIGTMRPTVSDEWVANVTRFDHVTRLDLDRLGPKALAALLRDSFRSEQLAEQLSYQIATKSDGNPFFVFEIIRGLREGQFIRQTEDGTWVSTRVIDEIQIPSSVLDLVNARVSVLGDDERNLLDVAACCGFEFDATLVGDALGLQRLPVLQTMAKLEKRDRLVRSSGRLFVFDHHQVQEALHGALPELLREEYHAALADALEARTNAAGNELATLDGALCADLCTHLLAGARGRRALRYLERANRHLVDTGRLVDAVTLHERALATPGLLTGSRRAGELLRLVAVLDMLGRRARQQECIDEALQLGEESGDDVVRLGAANALGWICLNTSRLAEAEAEFRRAIRIARESGDGKGEAVATGNLGLVFSNRGDLHEARELYERHLALSREIGDRAGEGRSLGNLGTIYRREGRWDEARELLGRRIAHAQELGDRPGEARGEGALAILLAEQGRRDDARTHFERDLGLCREIGDRMGEAGALVNLAVLYKEIGLLRASRSASEHGRALSREIGFREGEAVATGNLGVALEAEGRLDEAKEHYEVHLSLCREIAHRGGEVIALRNLGRRLRMEGDHERAAAYLEESAALAERCGDRYQLARARFEQGLLHAATGDPERGREALTEARDIAAEIGGPEVIALARCALAQLPGGAPEDARDAVAEHEDRLDVESRLEARWLLYRATGDRADLVEAKRALDAYLALNAPELHASMCTHVPTHREILAAWRHGSGAQDDASDSTPLDDSPACSA